MRSASVPNRSRSSSKVLRSRALTPTIAAPTSRARSTSSAECVSTSGVMPSWTMSSWSSASAVLLERGDDEQHEVGARGARLEHLVRLGDEVLAQHRDVDGGPHLGEVVERPAEASPLGQHADRARAAGLVRDREAGRVADLGEDAARRARALHLGDDLHAFGGASAESASRAGGRREGVGFDLREAARQRVAPKRRRRPRRRVRQASGLSTLGMVLRDVPRPLDAVAELREHERRR